MVRRAEQAQAGVRLAAQPLEQGLREPRLADARLARNQDDRALAALGLLPAPLQQRQLLVAADERRGGRAQCRKAAFDHALAHDPRGYDRRGKALDLDRPQILVVEQPGGQPPRARPDHHRPRLRQRLQPRREVRRLADHRLLLRRALADQVADHDQTGGDPDPHLQPRIGRGVETGHRLDQRQTGPHRPLGIVLVGARIAEIGEHPVAHVLGDKPAATLDDRGGAAVIAADHRPQILRVEPRRQRRRADQIAEQHRQLPPLGLGLMLTGRWRRCGLLGGAQPRNGAEQPFAVPHRDAELLEVGVGQLGQDLTVDLVLAE